MDISPKLQSWATEVARPHVSEIDPSFLRIDTQTITWKQLLANTLRSSAEEQGDRPWTLVNSMKDTVSQCKRNYSSKLFLTPTACIRPPVSFKDPVQESLPKLSSLRAAMAKAPAPAGIKTGALSPPGSPSSGSNTGSTLRTRAPPNFWKPPKLQASPRK